MFEVLMSGYLIVVGVALPIAFIFLRIGHSRLNARVSKLEYSLQHGDGAPDAARVNDGNPVSPPHNPKSATNAQVSKPEADTKSTPLPGDFGTENHKQAVPLNSTSDVRKTTDTPLKSYVFRGDIASRAKNWIFQNWHLAIAAISLALAGVFLVQYGAEQGLLTPVWRVLSAAGLGSVLIVLGEIIRRRWGDDADDQTAYLPSALAGAGLVVLFAAAISARQLYGLISLEAAFATMFAISILAIILGWFYGPFLAATGIIGATATPFVVGGSSEASHAFFYYFALIAMAGLSIDSLRRWAWVSVLAIFTAHAAALATFTANAGDVHYLVFAVVTAACAIAIPPFKLFPNHKGSTVAETFRGKIPALNWPEFPTRLAFGGYLGAIIISVLVALKDAGPVEVWAAITAIAALYILASVWTRDAPALCDLAIMAPIALIAVVASQGGLAGSLYNAFHLELPPESAVPRHVSTLAVLALIGSILAYWRATQSLQWRMIWSVGSALFTPVLLIALEIWWQPARTLGAGYWAIHPMIVAGLMTLLAERCIKTDRENKNRAAVFSLSALTMIAFALILMLSNIALTIALATMVAAAALLDRWLNMPPLAVLVQAGVIIVGWRLILDPGLYWADSAPLWDLVIGFGAPILLFTAAWVTLNPMMRVSTNLVLESAIWMLAAVFLLVLIYRALGSNSDTHWGMGLIGLVGLIAMAGQLYRLRDNSPLRAVRIGLASVYAIWGFGILAIAAKFNNPLKESGEIVFGPFVLDTLFVAYAFPALGLAIFTWKLDHIPSLLRHSMAGLASILVGYYLALEIRRFWRGDVLALPGTTGPELYSYTVALVIMSVALLFVAFARRSLFLRRLAMFGVAATIAKVFFIDMAELEGLIRVASFLGLGLSLAGLAWINRRMTDQWDRV